MNKIVKGILEGMAGLFVASLFFYKGWQPQRSMHSYLSNDSPKTGNQLLDPINFKNNKCYLNTKNIKRANGLKLDIYYPCEWESIIQSNDSIEDKNLIARYGYQRSDSIAYALSIDIKQAGFKISPSALEALRSKDGLKRVGEASGTFLEGISIEVKGVPGDEIVVKNNPTQEYYGYTLISHLYYNDNIISLRYIVLSTSDKIAAQVFQKERITFREWVFKTEFK